MAPKNAIQTTDLQRLESEIRRLHPSLTTSQVKNVRTKLLRYVSDGLSNGYDIALIKAVSKEEMSIKVLKLSEED